MHLHKSKNRAKPILLRMILYSLGLLIVLAMVVAYIGYRAIFAPNTDTGKNEPAVIFIPTGSEYRDVLDTLNRRSLLINERTFNWLAAKKGYPERVKPGRYIIIDGLSNLNLVNMLRSGSQVPVKVTFNNIRLSGQLAQVVSAQIEADSAELDRYLNDESFLAKYGLDRPNALALFIPNTYEFYWNTSALQFLERMKSESDRFWNDDRKAKAAAEGMTIPQVITLASIVEKETNKNDEKARIAGVYMNRLKKDWPLQADPTLIFATRDFTATRVLNEHKKVESPYNTYKYAGLPPGPICIPSIASIDAVLGYEKHDYMFFVADEALNGYHVFSKTLMEHNRHAKRYRQAIKSSGRNS